MNQTGFFWHERCFWHGAGNFAFLLPAGGEIQLTDALASRIGKAAFAGLKFSGQRYDCGSKIGFIKANMAFALQRPELRAELQKWLAEQISS